MYMHNVAPRHWASPPQLPCHGDATVNNGRGAKAPSGWFSRAVGRVTAGVKPHKFVEVFFQFLSDVKLPKLLQPAFLKLQMLLPLGLPQKRNRQVAGKNRWLWQHAAGICGLMKPSLSQVRHKLVSSVALRRTEFAHPKDFLENVPICLGVLSPPRLPSNT